MAQCGGGEAGGFAPGAGDWGGVDADAVVAGLYRENGAFVLGYVTGLLKDRHLAEDVVQETMLRAWRHCGEFRAEKGSVRGWLIRVAHNVAMDTVRMRRSRQAEVAEDAAPEAAVADHADAVVTAVQVRRALELLESVASCGDRGDLPEWVYCAGGCCAAGHSGGDGVLAFVLCAAYLAAGAGRAGGGCACGGGVAGRGAKGWGCRM